MPGSARAAWLDARKAELLPAPYFHLVFTLPPAAAEVAFQNKRLLYAALMRAAAEATMTLAANPKRLGARIGLLAVLHTWGQTLTHHPHVHCVVPGGGVSLDGERWIVCKPGFFLPVKALARLFRRLFLAALEATFDKGELRFFGELAPLCEPRAFAERIVALRKTDWIVYAKPPFGGPEQVLAYLARYTHRAAIANSRLVAAGDDDVAFSYKDYRRQGRRRIMRLSPDEFIRRFLLHVLPDGFHRIRHYGLLARGDREERARALSSARRRRRSSGRAEGPHLRGFVDRRNWRHLPMPRLRRTHAPHRHRSAREASPVPMRHVMSSAITSAQNPAQLPVSLVARCADGAPPRAASAKIFIIMTPIPRQTATNSGLLDRFPPIRRVLVSRHKRRRPPRPCAKRRRDALSP